MKRFYLTDDTYIKFSEEGFEKLENIKLITKENETIKAKMFYVNHDHFDKTYIVVAPIDMFEEEGEKNENY